VVVTHHEVTIGGHGDIANWRTQGFGVTPCFGEGFSVDVDRVALRTEVIAGQSDDSLDEIGNFDPAVLCGWCFEHHDVAAVDRAKVDAQLVHNEAIANLQRWLH